MKEKLKVKGFRKFLGALTISLMLSGIPGCSLGRNNDNDHSHDHTYTYEVETPSETENPEETPTPDEIENPTETQTPDETENPEIGDNLGNGDNAEDNSNDNTEEKKDDENLENNQNLGGETDPEYDFEMPNIGDYRGNSIVDALHLAGYDFSFNYRKQLATDLGIENYRGTAEQNIKLLNILKEYAKTHSKTDNADDNKNENGNEHNNENNNGNNNENTDNNGNTNDDENKKPSDEVKDDENHEHHFVSQFVAREKETAEGYDEVVYGYCDECNTAVEISRRYVNKQECEHANTRYVTEYENETETTHDEVVYELCDDCKTKKLVSRKTVNHGYEDTIVDNNNGTHSVVATYTCQNGKTYEKVLSTDECKYGDILTRKEDETEKGYYLVVYQLCTACGHEHIISNQYVEIQQECDHTKTHRETEYLDETETSHIEVTYDVCDDCGEKIEVSRREVSHTYEDKLVDNKDGTHAVMRIYKCADGKTYEKKLSDEYCNYGEIQTRQEDVTDDGYYLVTFEICAGCGHEHIISREYIDTKECDHSLTYEVTEYENETETEHDEVVYAVCKDCGRKKELSRTKVTHTVSDGVIKANEDGTHSFERTYTCPNGKVYSTTITVDCSYVKQKAVVENENDETHTYDLVVYEICTDCNHKVQVSKETKTHSYVDGNATSNHDETHSFTREYTRSDGTTYTVRMTDSCEFTEQEPVIENEDDETHTYDVVVYGMCEDCGHKKELSRVPTEQKYVDSTTKIPNEDGTHSVTRTYFRTDGTTYEITLNLEHEYVKQEPVIENENDETHTYDVVIYELCDCGHKREFSRIPTEQEYIDGTNKVSNEDGTHYVTRTYIRTDGTTYTVNMNAECEYVEQEPVIENENDETHTYDVVIYKICDCGDKKEVKRTPTDQEYVDSTTKTPNEDGTHSVTRTYTRSDGTTYEITLNLEHEYVEQEPVIENENDETHTYDVVIYKICDCGDKKEVKRTPTDQVYVDGTTLTSNENGTHSITRTYTRSDGTTYDITIDLECEYEQQEPVIENEDENGYDLVVYKACPCGHKVEVEELRQHVTKHQHNYSTDVSVITLEDGLLHNVHVCLNHNGDCGSRYEDLGLHEHEYEYTEPYKPMEGNKHSLSNGKCICGDTNDLVEDCTFVVYSVDDWGGDCMYYTQCEHCKRKGPEGYSETMVHVGDKYDDIIKAAGGLDDNNEEALENVARLRLK